MALGIQSVSEGSGLGNLYLDESGGFIQYTLTSGGYTSVHKAHVIPFGASSSGVYNSPGAGVEANLQQTADNLISLIKAVYDASSFGAAIGAYQVFTDNSGVQPYPYSFTTAAAFTAGTASGSPWPFFVDAGITGKSTDGARWQMHLPGPAQSVFSLFGRFAYAGVGSPVQALMDYITGVTNGPVHSAKTAVVAHDGLPIVAPTFALLATNKRLRRRGRVA